MTVPALNPDQVPRHRRRGALAMVAAGALAAATLGVVNAAPAAAEVRSVTAGSLQWGIKTGLLNYHHNHPEGNPTVTQGDGATAGGTNRFGPGPEFLAYPGHWTFPFANGTYDPATNDLTVQYSGFVLIRDDSGLAVGSPGVGGGGSPFSYLKLSNPKVILDFDSGGSRSLFVDVQTSEAGTATTTDFVNLAAGFVPPNTLTALSPATPAGDVVSYAGVGSFLTTAGAALFAGEGSPGGYSQFTDFDPVTFSATAPEGDGTPPPGPTVPISDASFEWGVHNYLQYLGTGASCHYLAAGDLNGADAANTYQASAGNVAILRGDGPATTYAERCGTGVGSYGTGTSVVTGGPAMNQRVRWTGGTGQYDPATGAGSVDFTGMLSMKYSGQTIRIVDPKLTVDDDGAGQLTGTVRVGNVLATATTVENVLIASFSDVTNTASGFVSTPLFDGVGAEFPAGTTVPTTVVRAGYDDDGDSLTNWGSFGPSWISAMTGGDHTRFYNTGIAVTGDGGKAPLPVTFAWTTGSGPGPAEGNQNVTFTIPTASDDCAGLIAWTIDGDQLVPLTESAVPGASRKYSGAIDPIEISDTRTGLSAACYLPFTISGQVSDFSNGTNTIDGANLGWTPSSTVPWITPGAAVASGYGGGNGLSESAPLGSVTDGASGAPRGTGTANADLAMEVPVEEEPGTYEGTLTLTGLT